MTKETRKKDLSLKRLKKNKYQREWYKNHPENIKAQRIKHMEWLKNNPDYYKNYSKKWKKEHSNYYKKSQLKTYKEDKKNGASQARQKVRIEVKNNRLPSLSKNFIKCTDCEKRAIQYDHRDYNKPLKVEPVCRGCNNKRGKAINKKGALS